MPMSMCVCGLVSECFFSSNIWSGSERHHRCISHTPIFGLTSHTHSLSLSCLFYLFIYLSHLQNKHSHHFESLTKCKFISHFTYSLITFVNEMAITLNSNQSQANTQPYLFVYFTIILTIFYSFFVTNRASFSLPC